MADAARQRDTDDLPRIMRGWITATEAAGRSGLSVRTINWRCHHKWQRLGRARQVGRAWYVDPTVDPAFQRLAPVEDTRAADLRHYSQAKRRTGAVRQQILRDIEQHVARRLSDTRLSRVDLIDEFVGLYGSGHRYGVRFSRRSIYRWQQASRQAPTTGLIDHRGLGRTDQRDEPPPEARSEFERRYLDLRKPTLTAVHAEMRLLAREHGWWWFGSIGTLRRWVQRTYTKAQLTLGRHGNDAYRRQCEPYLQLDPDSYEPGECYVGDHHQLRQWAMHQGKLIRPWLTAWCDMATGLFVGWSIVPSPNQATILAAARDAVIRHDNHIPKEWLVDNGKDYRGHAIAGTAHAQRKRYLQRGYLDEIDVAGVFGLLGSEIRFALPYGPNSKPVERHFQSLENSFGRRLPTYTGSDPNDRPEDLQKILATPTLVPSLEQLAEQWGSYIDQVHNAAPHPVFHSPRQELFDARTTTRPLANPDVLDLLMVLWSQPVKVSRNGVRFRNLLYGQWEPQLLSLQGSEVLVSYDPADISSVGVWTRDHRFICRAQQNQLRNRQVSDEDLRAGLTRRAQIKKALQVATKDRHAAYADTAALAVAAQAERMREQAERHRPAAIATGTSDDRPRTIAPVMTRLDDQVRAATRGALTPPPDATVIRTQRTEPDTMAGPTIVRLDDQRDRTLAAPPVVTGDSFSDKLLDTTRDDASA